MKLKIRADILHIIVSRAARYARPGGSHPVLATVLLEADKKGRVIRATGSNLDQAVRSSLAPDEVGDAILAGGKLCLDAARLSSVLHGFGGAEIEFVANESKATLSKGQTAYTLPAMPGADFPATRFDDTGEVLTLEAGTLANMLSAVVLAMSTNVTKANIHGVHLRTEAPGLCVVATNGRSMYRFAQKVESGLPEGPIAITLPAETVRPWVALLDDATKAAGEASLALTLNVTASSCVARWNGTELYTKLVAERYPNYSQVIPDLSKRDFDRVQVKPLKTALDLARVVMPDKDKRSLMLEGNDAGLLLSASDQAAGTFQDSVTIEGGVEGCAKLNRDYLVDALSSLPDDFVELSLGEGREAVVLCDTARSWVGVIMPVYSAA